jgi:hypothetical protein
VVAQVLLVFKPKKVPEGRSLNSEFITNLNATDDRSFLHTYQISSTRITGKKIDSIVLIDVV